MLILNFLHRKGNWNEKKDKQHKIFEIWKSGKEKRLTSIRFVYSALTFLVWVAENKADCLFCTLSSNSQSVNNSWILPPTIQYAI
jgi:hypothetical protein